MTFRLFRLFAHRSSLVFVLVVVVVVAFIPRPPPIAAATAAVHALPPHSYPPKGLIEHAIECDVFVAGGGSAGVSAALAAARSGAKVVLAQGKKILLGNAASDVRVSMVGATGGGGRTGHPLQTEAREGGIVEEYTLDNSVLNPQCCFEYHDLVVYGKLRGDPNVLLLLNTWLVSAEVNEHSENGLKRIVSVRCENQLSQNAYTIRARVYIDATGDGRLGVESGAEFIMGRESPDTYNESYAEGPDNKTEGSSLYYESADLGRPVTFKPPSWARKFVKEDFKFRNGGTPFWGVWWNEVAWPYNTITDDQMIVDELLSNSLGLWDYRKNSGEFPETKNWALSYLGWVGGKREGRRFIGQYVMRQRDIVPVPELFHDRVAYGGWPIDLHNPSGILDTVHPPNIDHSVPYLYSTPLSSLLSKDVSNLMFAGRLASFSHVVYGTQRVMKTCSTAGQAAGTAAAYAVLHNVSSPVFLHKDALAVWSIQQQLIRDDAFIIGVYNEDPRDYARSAIISASSFYPGGESELVVSGQSRAIDGPKGAYPGQSKKGWNRWASSALPAWIQLSWSQPIAIARVELVFDTGMHRQLTMHSNLDSAGARMIWGRPQNETVKNYEIQVQQKKSSQWSCVVSVKDNYQRRRVHDIDSMTVQSLRIVASETNGLEHVHINEIRVYGLDGKAPFPKQV